MTLNVGAGTIRRRGARASRRATLKDLLDEMTRRTETRFLVITHHAVTMARMDRLFGVTMVEQGVSQLVSVDLKKAAALVA